MGMASHLGPWLLGTVKNSLASISATNASQGLNRNMGATTVTQSFAISGTGGTQTVNGCVIPAGSQIVSAQIYVTNAFSAGTTCTASLNSTVITGAITITAAGAPNIGPGADGTRAALYANTGSVDKVFVINIGGAPTGGDGIVSVTYAVRNADGSTAPTSSQV